MKQRTIVQIGKQKKADVAVRRGDWLRRTSFFCGCFVYLEILLHFFVFHSADVHIVYPVLFGLMSGVLCAMLIGVFPRILRRIFAFLLVFAHCMLAEIQLIYYAVFGNLMPISQLRMGGGVINDFFGQTVYAVRQNILSVLALQLPLFLLILFLALKKAPAERSGWRGTLHSLSVLVLLSFLTFGSMRFACTHPTPIWQIFNSVRTSTNQSYRNVGMSATTLQELRCLIFPVEEKDELLNAETSASATEYDPAKWNVLPDLNFEALAATTDDPSLQELDHFFAAVTPTEKNEYTGLFRGYNIIELCAESYCPWFVSEELTPTLWEMTHSGIVFDNYYGCFNYMTTNGEYTLCLGLLPDTTREKYESSFDESVGHYLPFCLGTCLKDFGYTTWAYHNNNGEFYNRSRTHPNMGYCFQAQGSGLNVTPSRPASDLEMIQQSMEDYLYSDQPFHAYYMTYSGHYEYSWGNAMSAKHRAEVEDLPLSEEVKAYIACNLELEAALSYMVEALDQAGKLDKTVIILTNDHYPYGLTQAQYNELAGREIDQEFEIYRNDLICYAPGLGRTIHTEAYCSTVDVLPTLLNLLDVPFDSRLLPGVDIFSFARHAAILQDGSFITEGFRFSESSGKLYCDEGAQVDDATLEEYRQWVRERFVISRKLLDTDYYAHAFPGSHDIVEGESLPFDDVMNIRPQANCLFIYRMGLVDLYAERTFAEKAPATIGDWVTAVYRYLDRPAAQESALPASYLSDEPEKLEAFRNSPQYDAVCWAFSQGLLKSDDRLSDYSAPMDNAAMCLMLYRTTALLGLGDTEISPEAETLVPENGAWIEGEERQAVAWAIEHRMIAGEPGMENTLFAKSPDNTVTRYRLVLFLMKLFYPNIQR